MKLKKRQIQQKFNQASTTYDQVALVQRECAKKLVGHLTNFFPKFYPNTILDIGTGTGYIPELLLSTFSQSSFTLNDLSPEMLKKTKEKLGKNRKIDFIQGDMDNLNFGFKELVTSNFAMQWSSDLHNILARLHKKSDVLAFSCLLDGTFKEWGEIFEKCELPNPTFHYPIKKELENYILSLRPQKYFFDSKEFVLDFSSPLKFLKYLKELGANTGGQEIPIKDILRLLRNNLGGFSVTYNVFFALIGGK